MYVFLANPSIWMRLLDIRGCCLESIRVPTKSNPLASAFLDFLNKLLYRMNLKPIIN
jgi:hypothetical protein